MTEEVREAVQILLNRMKSHPDDFERGGKFAWVASTLSGGSEHITGYGLTDHEVLAIRMGLDSLRYDKFHTQVMSTLLNEERVEDPFMKTQGSSLKPIFLTTTQAALAKKLGVTARDFAAALSEAQTPQRAKP